MKRKVFRRSNYVKVVKRANIRKAKKIIVMVCPHCGSYLKK